MDENKLQRLKEISYRIKPCCGLCEHSAIGQDGWGVCKKFAYAHLKHTGEQRDLSINRMGLCDSFTSREKALSLLGRFKEFFNK